MKGLKFWIGVGGFLSGLMALLFSRKSSGKEEIQKPNGAEVADEIEAIEAEADRKKEKINHEAQQDLDDLANTSDDDLVADTIAEYRRRNGPGPDVEDPPADD